MGPRSSKFCIAKRNCGLAGSASPSRLRHGKKGKHKPKQRKREQENEKITYVKEQINKLKVKWESVMLKNKAASKRIIKAFPNIKSLQYNASLDRLKEEIRKIRKDK